MAQAVFGNHPLKHHFQGSPQQACAQVQKSFILFAGLSFSPFSP